MHSLSSSFILGYHGCDRQVGETFLRGEAFHPSKNDYDWLGSGIYFWEANPDRALQWAEERSKRLAAKGETMAPFVVGAVIDPGFCLDLASSNGVLAAQKAYEELRNLSAVSGISLPLNSGGSDRLARRLDCAVINYLHKTREKNGEVPLDSVRGIFMEGEPAYEGSEIRAKTHVQLCVRNPENIHGVFRVHKRYFSTR